MILPSLSHFGVCIAGAGAQLTGVGGGSAPAMPFLADDFMPDPKTIGPVLWVLGGIIGLVMLIGAVCGAIIGVMMVVDRIKDRKEKISGHITNDPLKVETVDKCVRHGELTVKLAGFAEKSDLTQTEHRLQGQIDIKFNQLNADRRADIKDLHNKIESRVDVLRAESADSAKEIRDQLADMPTKLLGMLAQFVGAKKS